MKKGSLKNKLDKLLNSILIAGALFYGSTQTANWVNDAAQAINPSPQRTYFKERLGTSLNGWTKNVEKDPYGLFYAARVLAEEKTQIPFNLSEIRFTPNSYFQKNIPEQVASLGRFDGLYGLNTIYLKDGARAIRHEIMHARADEVSQKHPEFKRKWTEAASFDGKNPYLNPIIHQISKFTLFQHIRPNIPESKLLEKGFVSNYAATSVDEDIAEFCSELKDFMPADLSREICDKNPILNKKLDLAMEYGLVPKNVREYFEMQRICNSAYTGYHGAIWIEDTNRANEFLEKSLEFIAQNPVYEAELRSRRGKIMRYLSAKYESGEQKEKLLTGAEQEFKKALIPSDLSSYVDALSNLEDLYILRGEKEKRDIFFDALEIFNKRREACDLTLLDRGVNDYLTSRGAL